MKGYNHFKALLLILSSICVTNISAKTNTSAFPFELKDVSLEESWIKQRETLNIEYLKSLDVDRLLHNFRINAGLPSDAKPLEGWESPNIGLRGHFVGHFLSAASSVVKRYNDPVLSKRLNYMTDELEKCQTALKHGYLSAFPETEFDRLEANEGGIWAPYYTYHKIMQGLLDVYTNTGNEKAYKIVLRMADYVDMRMGKLDNTTISRMLYTTQANPSNEPGGMNEVLYRLYKISKDKKHLKLAQIFDRDWLLTPLINNKDILSGLHSNTHIALVNGFAECYDVTNNTKYYDAVKNFWDILMSSHAYANGSSSGPRPNATTPTSLSSEHWGKPKQLSSTLSGYIAESCVSHNTQKLTSKLFTWTTNPKYADAYMNSFYNSIMALQNSKNGAFVYHLPLGSPRKKSFLNSYADFRCCNGSSIEAFSLLNNNIYFHKNNGLWINMYIPSILNWEEYGVKLSQDKDFIYSHEAEIKLNMSSRQKLNINLFIPSWSYKTKIYVNGKLQGTASPNSFFSLDRIWNDNDSISIKFDFNFRIEHLQNDENTIAIFYGPLLLAFESKKEIVLYGDAKDILNDLKIENENDLIFVLNNGEDKYYLKPLFFITDESYSVYVQTNRL